MKLFLKKGECKWSSEGVHICDEHGFAVICEEDCEVEIADAEKFAKAQRIVSEDRAFRNSPISAITFASSSIQSAPEELPEQPAQEESPQVHAEPEPQEHGPETSEAP